MKIKNIIYITLLVFVGIFAMGVYNTMAIGIDTGCGSCGGFGDGPGYDNNPNPDVVTCTLRAVPQTVSQGGYATLEWTTSLATGAVIDNNVGSVNINNGSVQVGPINNTTTFKMSVTGNGIPGACYAKIKVNQPTTPPSCMISATPALVNYGSSSTLVWSSNNATSATITELGATGLSGSYIVNNITSNKTYTMTVTGPGGSTVCSTSINVTSIPGGDLSCNIYASPNPTLTGNTTLRWYSYGNVIWAKLNGVYVPKDGSKYVTDIPLNGSKTYSLTINNGYKTSVCEIRVNGQNSASPYCSLNVSKNNINAGESTVLTWTSNNAISAIFSDNGAVSLSGSRVIMPSFSRYYKLIVTSSNGVQDSCQVYVDVKNSTVVNVSSIPYTGPNDVLYITIMGIVSISSFVILYYRRHKIKRLFKI